MFRISILYTVTMSLSPFSAAYRQSQRVLWRWSGEYGSRSWTGANSTRALRCVCDDRIHSKPLLSSLSPKHFSPFLSRIAAYSTKADPPDNVDSSAPAPMQYITLPDLSEEDQNRFKVLQFEFEVLKQSGNQVPSTIKEHEWRRVLNQSSRSGRIKFYRFLFKNEMHDLNEKKRKVARSAIRDVKHEQLRREVEENPEGIRYGLNMNTFFPYIRETTMLATQNIKLAQARMFGQPLIFDLDYDDWMDGREQTNTAMQIRDAHAYNKDARDPFWYQICNARPDGTTMQSMKRGIPNLEEPSCLIHVSEKSYLDLFPKERLVYLSYNAEDTLMKFNPDDIYIIGGLVDKTNPKPLSMAKCKKEGLRRAKLPLDVYVRWAMGGKNLTINQVAALLTDVKEHGDWERALVKHIPKRKLLQPEDLQSSPAAPYHKQQQYRAPLNDRYPVRRRREQQQFRSVLESLLSQ